MRLLIVDDSASKLADILALVRETSNCFEVETCLDCVGAIDKLTNHFDLIIIDVLLPIRKGELPVENGGKYIVDQIYRNKTLCAPTYILFLSQYENLVTNIHPIWKVIRYNPSEIGWKICIKEYLVYISRKHFSESRIIIEKVPTIFLEGKSDERLFNDCLNIHFPHLVSKLKIVSEVGAGADWVTRKLIIWGCSLPKDHMGNYVKAIGVFDNDLKGNDAIVELSRAIKQNSAEAKCIKSVKYQTKHARHLISIYSLGINLPITLEELFPQFCWEYACLQGWLEPRSNTDLLLKDPGGWDKMKMSLSDYIDTLGVASGDKLYLSKIRDQNKEEFSKYIVTLEEDKKEIAYEGIKLIITEFVREAGIE